MAPSVSTVLQEVITTYSRPNSVKIKDEFSVLKKLLAIISDGPDKLHVITDFDYTLTKYHFNGDKCDSSDEIIANSSLVPAEYKEKAMELYYKYHPVEISTTMTIEEKIPFVMKWYQGVIAQLIALPQNLLKRETLTDMVALTNTNLRENAKITIERLAEADVPLVVLSAGIGDVVEAVLEKFDVNLPNVRVISNFFQFDKAGHLLGFKNPFIHMFNKNEAAMHDDNSQYFRDLNSRDNVILLGDTVGDANMSHGVPNCENVLKIGFLNSYFEEHLDQFVDTFDIVLVDDQSFDFVNHLLDQILD